MREKARRERERERESQHESSRAERNLREFFNITICFYVLNIVCNFINMVRTN